MKKQSLLPLLALVSGAAAFVLRLLQNRTGFEAATGLPVPGNVPGLVLVALLAVLTLPAIFSENLWSGVRIFGKTFMDLEDYIVSNLLLPVGSLCYVLFCTSRYGWGWKNFEGEVNSGRGVKLPRWLRPYMTWVLPVIIAIIIVISIF